MSYLDEKLSLYRTGLTFLGRNGIDESPQAMYKELISQVVSSKQSYDEMPRRLGFGLFQQTNTGTMTTVVEEEINSKRVATSRYSLGYELPANALERDPNGFAKSKAQSLTASAVHTMNYLAQMAFVRGALTNTDPNSITSVVDGLPIYSSAHPVSGSANQSNKVTTDASASAFITMLSEMAAQFTREGTPAMQASGGFDIFCSPRKAMDIQVIIDSELVAGSNNNDKNLLGQRINKVLPLTWLAFAGSSYDDDYWIQPSAAADRKFFALQTQALQVATDPEPKIGMIGTYASFEITFNALDHYQTYYSS